MCAHRDESEQVDCVCRERGAREKIRGRERVRVSEMEGNMGEVYVCGCGCVIRTTEASRGCISGQRVALHHPLYRRLLRDKNTPHFIAGSLPARFDEDGSIKDAYLDTGQTPSVPERKPPRPKRTVIFAVSWGMR